MRKKTCFCLAAAALTAFVEVAYAQSGLYQFRGWYLDHLGRALAAAGDVDQDGQADWVQSAFFQDRVEVRSGRDGRAIFVFKDEGTATISYFGEHLAAGGDVDQDGFPDVALSRRYGPPPYSGPAFRMYSGKDGVLLHDLHIDGIEAQSTGCIDFADVNADGFSDLVAGTAQSSVANLYHCGRTRVVSGKDESILFDVAGIVPNEYIGYTAAALGDIDLDGYDDFAFGARFGVNPIGATTGWVRIYSGQSNTLLKSIYGTSFQIGTTLAGTGDVDGDQIPDLAFGDYYGVNRVSCATFAQLPVIATPNGLPVRSLGGRGDVDQDGRADLAVGAFTELSLPPGSAFVFSGGSGSLLATMSGQQNGDELGTSVAILGDVDQDGRADYAAGAPESDAPYINSGYVRVMSSASTPVWSLGGASASGGSSIVATGSPTPGATFGIVVSGAPPSTNAFLVLGLHTISLAYQGGVVVPDVKLVLPIAIDSQGGFSAAATWPPDVPGSTRWCQLVAPDPAIPGRWLMSNALAITTQ